MTEDFKHDSRIGSETASMYRLCRHNYAGTLHLTNFWWSDASDEVLGTGALPELTWLDPQGRARLRIDLGVQRVRLQVLSSDARDCLTPLTTYHLEDSPGHVVFVRQIEDEVAREADAMDAATRGIAVADAWLAALETVDLRPIWASEMVNRGYAGDAALDSPYHTMMPTRLVQQARRTWAAAYDGAKERHLALSAEWKALALGSEDAAVHG
jgi:hypothetical protein